MTNEVRALPSMDPPAPASAGAEIAISVEGVHKAYGPAGSHVLALSDMSLTVAKGEFVCLVGASGCGKSTLLNILARLDKAQLGR